MITSQGFFSLVSGVGSALAASKRDADGHGFNCGNSSCISIRKIWRIDNIPGRKARRLKFFPDHFQVGKTGVAEERAYAGHMSNFTDAF